MAACGFITPGQERRARQRPIEVVLGQHKEKTIEASAVVDNVLDELTSRQSDLSVKDLLQGRIQVYSTVEAGVNLCVSPFRCDWKVTPWSVILRSPDRLKTW